MASQSRIQLQSTPCFVRAGAAAALILTASLPADAQIWRSEVTPAKGPATQQARPTKAAVPQPHPASQLAAPATQSSLDVQSQYLVRTTLMALNDANRTGNYTVLRDIAGPSFRSRNSAADLGVIFAELRRSRLDLSVAALMQPTFQGVPALDQDRRLHLKGLYATEPNRIVFELVFEAVAGNWQLYGITISTTPSRTAAAPVR